jgi:hypothetical protein
MAKKRCLVVVEIPADEHGPIQQARCGDRVKPGTGDDRVGLCAEHYKTHKMVFEECYGEAHQIKGPGPDHCGVCMPYWGKYPIAVPREDPTPEGTIKKEHLT